MYSVFVGYTDLGTVHVYSVNSWFAALGIYRQARQAGRPVSVAKTPIKFGLTSHRIGTPASYWRGSL